MVAIGAEKAVNLAWLADETNVVDGADGAALFVLEDFAQTTSLDHKEPSTAEEEWANWMLAKDTRLPRRKYH
jgi:hypothetical protein